MNIFKFVCVVCLVCLVGSAGAVVRNRTQYIDTRIGTGGAAWGMGVLNPAAQVPFGCMRLGPDTSLGWEPFRVTFNDRAGYFYENDHVECFSHNHIVGAGEGDFQNFGVMVTRQWNNHVVNNCNYRSSYSHEKEIALPGYYAVELPSANTYAELTVSGTHSGIHRYTCRSMSPDSSEPCVLVIDMCHGVTVKLGNLDVGESCKNAQIVNISSRDNGLSYEIDAWMVDAGEFMVSVNNPGVKIYFHAVVSANVPLSVGTWANKSLTEGLFFDETQSGSLGVGFIAEASSSSVEFIVRSAISYVSQSNARLNLETQQKTVDQNWLSFEGAMQNTVDAWENVLSAVEYSGGVANSSWHQRVFESALYRTQLSPTIYNDVNGEYLGQDMAVHVVDEGHRFLSDLSIWDTYRTVAPLLLWTKPDYAVNLANSMMEMVNETGRLPMWVLANVEIFCMVGLHSAIIFTDYIMKGLGGISSAQIFDAVVKGIRKLSEGTLAEGFVSQDSDQYGCSLTQDYSLDAGAVWHLANFLGNQSVASEFQTYAMSYKNIWDNKTSYFCPRYANGTFFCQYPFTLYPFEVYYIEGNAAQYRWYVPHDIRGMIGLFPNASYFADELNEFFGLAGLWELNTTFPNWAFWAGNEPDLLAPFLFNWAGNEFAHLTSKWMPKLLDDNYTPEASGIPGNDDYGTLSAWAMYGYMGFYPVASTNEYALFAPRFDSIDIRVDASGMLVSPWRSAVQAAPNGARTTTVQIRAYNRPAQGTAYVANISVNKVPLLVPIVTQSQLLNTIDGQPTLIEYFLTDEATVFAAKSPSQGGPDVYQPRPIVSIDPYDSFEVCWR